MSTAAEAVGSKDYLGMSDEDFLKVNAPEAAPAAEVTITEKSEEEKAAEAAAAEAAKTVEKTAEELAAEEKATKDAADKAAADAALADDPAAQAAAVVAAAGDPDKSKTNAEKAKEKQEKAAKEAADAAAKAEADKTKTPEQLKAEKEEADRIAAGGKPKTDAEKEAERVAAEAAANVKAPPKPEELQAFYNSLIGTPIKANGKTITLNNPEEVLRLVQMGAGLGKKLQTIQPHLKVVKMLEKNDLLDPDKLSFLIDINSKNPDAIKKLIKDAGIDPLDINTGDNVSYVPKNHSVSDQELSFREALSDIQSHEGGKETLQEIDQTWDNESKALLFQEPQLLQVIQSQRDNGIYAKITAEIDRQKMLGTIPHSTSFLKAYQIAGDILFPKTPQAQQIQTPAVVTPPEVIATRVEAPKAPVKNNDKAAAAAAPKTSSSRKPAPINPLAMADDDFMKTFSGRL